MDKKELTEWLWMIAACLGVCGGILILWYITWKITQHILGG